MGKQINYYMDYESFLKVVQIALDEGCMLLHTDHTPKPQKPTTDIEMTKEHTSFKLYLPELAELKYAQDMYGNYYIDDIFNELWIAQIEIGYSQKYDQLMRVNRSRIYIPTGFDDKNGIWIARSERLTKVYDKLARAVRKLAPSTTIEFDYVAKKDGRYSDPQRSQRKVYATPQCLEWRAQGYEYDELTYHRNCYREYLKQCESEAATAKE